MAGEVALGNAPGDLRGGGRLAAELAVQAGGDAHHHQRHQRADPQQQAQRLPQLGAERGLDVIQVQPGDKVPVPRAEVGHVAQLGLRRLGARLGPQVFDEAPAGALADRGDVAEQVDAVGVLRSLHRLAVHLRLERVHQHHGVGAHQREVAIGAKAHRAHALDGLLLRLVGGELARPGQRLVLGHHRDRGVGDVGQVEPALIHAQRAYVPGVPQRDAEQADPAQHQRQQQFFLQAQVVQHAFHSSFSALRIAHR
ncbi:hypothetical protein D9M72_299350 [compost metagenome]